MMFVGDKGRIISGFRCENPKLLPEEKMTAWLQNNPPHKEETESGDPHWINAFKNKTQSPGSFFECWTGNRNNSVGRRFITGKEKAGI